MLRLSYFPKVIPSKDQLFLYSSTGYLLSLVSGKTKPVGAGHRTDQVAAFLPESFFELLCVEVFPSYFNCEAVSREMCPEKAERSIWGDMLLG